MFKITSFPSKRLGAAIKQRRKRLALSQTQLGEFAGCGLTFISQLERGKATVRLNKLLDVLKILGLSLTLESGKETLLIAEKLGSGK